MALVDLLSAEFMGRKLQGSVKMQIKCFIAALLGRNLKSIYLSNPEEPNDAPHIKLKLLTRRIHQRKPFVNPISDTPILAKTILGAILVFWNPNSGKTPNCSCLCSGLQTPDQLQPQGVPEPRRPQFPVHITASLSSQSTHSQTQEEDASDVLSAHPRPDAKPSDPDQTRLSSARDRSRSSHLASVRGSLGGPGSTICKQKIETLKLISKMKALG
uniref:Uncharacterized protein n=1 Tax=Brassica oleracea var. oleracea TaxID=109376 RepID=A0A0D3BKI1_BRAOL